MTESAYSRDMTSYTFKPANQTELASAEFEHRSVWVPSSDPLANQNIGSGLIALPVEEDREVFRDTLRGLVEALAEVHRERDKLSGELSEALRENAKLTRERDEARSRADYHKQQWTHAADNVHRLEQELRQARADCDQLRHVLRTERPVDETQQKLDRLLALARVDFRLIHGRAH
jgi:regulator of replication initiation timing